MVAGFLCALWARWQGAGTGGGRCAVRMGCVGCGRLARMCTNVLNFGIIYT